MLSLIYEQDRHEENTYFDQMEFNDISCIQQKIKCEGGDIMIRDSVANLTRIFEVFHEKLWI